MRISTISEMLELFAVDTVSNEDVLLSRWESVTDVSSVEHSVWVLPSLLPCFECTGKMLALAGREKFDWLACDTLACRSPAAELGVDTDSVKMEGTDLAGRNGPW